MLPIARNHTALEPSGHLQDGSLEGQPARRVLQTPRSVHLSGNAFDLHVRRARSSSRRASMPITTVPTWTLRSTPHNLDIWRPNLRAKTGLPGVYATPLGCFWRFGALLHCLGVGDCWGRLRWWSLLFLRPGPSGADVESHFQPSVKRSFVVINTYEH